MWYEDCCVVGMETTEITAKLAEASRNLKLALLALRKAEAMGEWDSETSLTAGTARQATEDALAALRGE